MLFNSYSFLLVFLPVTLAGFFLFGRLGQLAGATWLAAASLFFYGWWDYRFLPLLLGSIIFNYGIAHLLVAGKKSRPILVAAISANLLLLAYYKYAGFFVNTFTELMGWPRWAVHVVLPIGISFFTFTQIAFLVDTWQGKVKEKGFVNYLLFVTYFPHLIAGPVLHHKEMMPQFADPNIYRISSRAFSVGATIFCIGLAKKVLIADNLAPFVAPVFDGGGAPNLLLAWSGVLAYAFQLYFDFSGYSDMAIGLSRLFGVRLPLNFDSPYKSSDIAEFWRRWHMTLSRFLRDYLYIPLGGNRHGTIRRAFNLMATMALGGLWHGSGWNFVLWGVLHGIFLIAHQLWTSIARRMAWPVDATWWRHTATFLTFLAVCFAWVFFRAIDLPSAGRVLLGMTGHYGMALPESVFRHLGSLHGVFNALHIGSYPGGGSVFVESWCWIGAAAVIVFAFPNTQEIARRFEPALDFVVKPTQRVGIIGRFLIWTPSRQWAVALAVLTLVSLLSLNRPAEFLYFQF